MTITRTCMWLMALACWSAEGQPKLEMVPFAEPQCAFAGSKANVKAVFHNAGDADFSGEMGMKLFLTSSSTVAPLDERPWKKLNVLAGQTIIESAPLEMPKVERVTKVLIRWVEPVSHVAGDAEVIVYPTNLLHELKLLLGDDGATFGVLDPHRQFKPALEQAEIKFIDLAETEMSGFSGKLALVGPCDPDDPEWDGLADRIQAVAKKGTPVVWIQRSPRDEDATPPSYYVAPQNRTAVVVAQPELVSNMFDNPRSQLNLLHFCKLALLPEIPALPNLSRK